MTIGWQRLEPSLYWMRPNEVLLALDLSPDQFREEVKILIAVKLYCAPSGEQFRVESLRNKDRWTQAPWPYIHPLVHHHPNLIAD